MTRRILAMLPAALLLATAAPAQTQDGGYLDVLTIRVKPDKRADFDAVIKKLVAANKQNNGLNWLASGTVYGDRQAMYFVVARPNLAGFEEANNTFMAAMTKAVGAAGVPKVFAELNNCIESSRGELRRLRLDLSRNASPDLLERTKLAGKLSWRRTMITRVRPGHVSEYVSAIQMLNAALAGASTPSPLTTYVMQGAGGQTGTVFYSTTLAGSLGDLELRSSLSQLMGEENYQKYQKALADSVLYSETQVTRVNPDLSNPTPEMVSAAPEFWKPKPAAARPTELARKR